MSSQSGFQLAEAGPGAYERYMVPTHCDCRTPDLLDRVHLQPGEHVLDVACGSGTVSRHAAKRVGERGRVVGVDLNPGMLDVARQASTFGRPIEFLEGDAAKLPVPDASFDVALCQHSIMFYPDRESAVREMHRALKPGGRVGASVFRTREYNPAFEHLTQALDNHGWTEAAGFLRSPFVIESADEMREMFKQAGFTDIVVTNRIETLRYPSVEHLVRYETLNVPDPALQSDEAQATLVQEMNGRVADSKDDHGVAFPSQDFVVIANR